MSSTRDRRTLGQGIRQASRIESHLSAEQPAECLVSPDTPGEVEEHSGEDASRRDLSDDRLEEEEEEAVRKPKPWWKRPSPWWLLAVMPFNSIASSSKLAPRIEIYTTLVCAKHRPGILGANPRAAHGIILPQSAVYAPEIPMAYVQFPEFHINETIKTHSTPPNWKKCAADPIVQASVAKLIAVITTCSGILSLLTTGWWGSYSDRHGRARVLLITATGNLIADVNFIFVTNFHAHLPGGYWFFVVGSIVDGILGSFTTGVAAHHTYLTDTADAHNRSRILSLNVGLLYTGMAIGPTLGSLLVRATGRTLSVFCMAFIIELLYVSLLSFILPESITKEQMALSRAKYHANISNSTAERQVNTAMGILRRVKRTFAFFSPLTIFMPLAGKSHTNALRKPRRDWTLAMLATAYGLTISVMGSLQFKFQYAASAFGWTSEQIGYWLSLLGATRAFVMTAILPVAIKVLKPKPVQQGNTVQPTQTETSPLLETTRENRKTIELSSFDLSLARCSLLVDVISYFFMAIAQNAYQFTISAIMGSFGLGFNPAMQSVTLALHTRQGGTESGRLFGALSVVQAISSQILGPSLYGFVYVRTVATFPRAIFYVTVVTLIISSTILLLVRLPKEDHRQMDSEEEGNVHDALLQGNDF